MKTAAASKRVGYRTHIWPEMIAGERGYSVTVFAPDGTLICDAWNRGARTEALREAYHATCEHYDAVKAAGVLQPPVKLGASA